jgi:hypothetical protein
MASNGLAGRLAVWRLPDALALTKTELTTVPKPKAWPSPIADRGALRMRADLEGAPPCAVAAATTLRTGGIARSCPLASFLEGPEKQLRRGGIPTLTGVMHLELTGRRAIITGADSGASRRLEVRAKEQAWWRVIHVRPLGTDRQKALHQCDATGVSEQLLRRSGVLRCQAGRAVAENQRTVDAKISSTAGHNSAFPRSRLSRQDFAGTLSRNAGG